MDDQIIIGSAVAFRLALLDAGLLDAAEEAAKDNPRLTIRWAHSINIISSDDWVVELAGLMGIKIEKVESLIQQSWSL